MGCCSGASATTRCCSSGPGRSSSPSAPTARTITVRSSTASSSATRCGARSITPASACEAGRCFVRLRWIPFRAGVSSGKARPCRFARSWWPRGRRDPPVDRPNLSKDFLAGEAQDDWIPLWPPETYAERHVDLVLRRRVSSIDPVSRSVLLDDGSRREFGALLIATGADPVRLPIPGADSRQVFYLRSFADSRAIVERARAAKHVVVVGASFIGLEVSASLRARGIAVDVVAPERVPLERVMGVEVGRFVQSLHEAQGVVFHLGQTVSSVAGRTVTLSGGGTLDADFVVVGVGVRPATAVAEESGLALDRGIAVNEYLETSAPGVFAAGDVARWPDPHTGERIRVEHWVVAERQGQ